MNIAGPILLSIFTMLILILTLTFRHKRAELAHAERMAALEKGVALPAFPQEPTTPARRSLLAGMIWLFSGAGLVIFVGSLAATLPKPIQLNEDQKRAKIEELRKLGAEDWELRQIVYEGRTPQIPAGMALIGLIPMGVGLAYLIFFFTERKRALT